MYLAHKPFMATDCNIYHLWNIISQFTRQSKSAFFWLPLVLLEHLHKFLYLCLCVCFAEEVLQSPSLYLTKPTSEEIDQNKTATFACFAAGFSPPVHTFKWMKEEGDDKQEMASWYSFTSTVNGTNFATSYLQVPENMWKHRDTKITCISEHKTGQKSRSVGYQFGTGKVLFLSNACLYYFTETSSQWSRLVKVAYK